MWFDLSESATRLVVHTPDLELGWSRDDGALCVLRHPGGPSTLGHGHARPSLDVAIGDPQAWTSTRSFARYLDHRVDANDDGIVVSVAVGIGPLKIWDHYQIRAGGALRRVEVENVGLDDLRVCGLQLCLPGARVGAPEGCRFEAPANSVRPRLPLAVAADQRREVLPRRFFAPGLRGGSALEPAPSQGHGLLALHSPAERLSLLCWYDSPDEPALPYLDGDPGQRDCVTLGHEVALAGWLRPGERLAAGSQHLQLYAGDWGGALASYRAAAARAHPPASAPAWLRELPHYIADPARTGGLDGLRASLPDLARLGVGVLILLPTYRTAGDRHTVVAYEQPDPAIGGGEALAALVEAAHRLGIYVLLDLALQGCAAESPYLAEHPEWFVRDAGGAFVIGQPAGVPAASAHPGVRVPAGSYSLDWHNHELRDHVLTWAEGLAATAGLDGYRAVAAASPALNWARRPPAHASDGSLAPLELLAELRRRLRRTNPAAALLSTLPGPAFAGSCDAIYDYLAHHMFIHAAMGRVEPAELGRYMGDAGRVALSATRIGFMESHDTWAINPLADGLRGSRFSRMLLAGMAFCGLVPSLWAGQEQGDEPFLRALLGLWRGEPALREGQLSYGAALAPAAPGVFSVLREHRGRRLLGLLHFGPQPRPQPFIARGQQGAVRDLLGMAELRTGPGGEPGRLIAELAPFSAYCLELS